MTTQTISYRDKKCIRTEYKMLYMYMYKMKYSLFVFIFIIIFSGMHFKPVCMHTYSVYSI